MIISPETVAQALRQTGATDIKQLSIREMGKLVSIIEKLTGIEFIHMEMGVPGLPACEIGLQAEREALDTGCASQYTNIEGIATLKPEIARFARNFMDIDVPPESCIPTVGSMQGSFAAFLAAARSNAKRPCTLFIDPGFPVQKQQLTLLGCPFKSFDLIDCRGQKLRGRLESFLSQGDICSISYSSPNNPAWVCLTEEELQIIGELATKYDVMVIEDLAYFGMDFRHDYGHPGIPPYQPTVAHYTDNYILLMSASKIFSYAGQRIAMMIISPALYGRSYPDLRNYFTTDKLGHFIPYGVLYATTAGTSHTAQIALAAMLKAANDGIFNFVEPLKDYERKAARMKELFLQNGFHLVYTETGNRLADGFYFTIAYKDMGSGELLAELLNYGISAIALDITGSTSKQGLRACVSFVRHDQMDELEKRLRMFAQEH